MIFEWIGNILIALSIVLVFIGLFGVFRFKELHKKVFVAANIEVVAFLTLLIGTIFRSGLTWFSLKVFLILVFYMFLSPVITNKVLLSIHTEEQIQQKGEAK